MYMYYEGKEKYNRKPTEIETIPPLGLDLPIFISKFTQDSRQNHSLDNGIHGLNLSHILILSLVAGGEDGPTPPPALEVDHLLLLVPLQLDLVAPGEDRLQASADGDQDGDERASDGEESARGTGDLRPKDDAAVHPPQYMYKFTIPVGKILCHTRQWGRGRGRWRGWGG